MTIWDDKTAEARERRRKLDEKKFGYALAKNPEWTLEDCQKLAIEAAMDALEHKDRPRLKSLSVEPYVPTTAGHDPHATGLTEGGLVMLEGFLASEGNESKGRVFRCTIPRLIAASDLRRILDHFALALPNAIAIMEKEERQARILGAPSIDDPAQGTA